MELSCWDCESNVSGDILKALRVGLNSRGGVGDVDICVGLDGGGVESAPAEDAYPAEQPIPKSVGSEASERKGDEDV